MSRRPPIFALLALLAGLSLPAQAVEYRTVESATVLYDAPSVKGAKLFVVRRGTPVEVVVTLDKWIKVREPGGSLNWVERRVLANRRTVLVTAERAAVRREARDDAPLSFEAARNVVLELAEPPSLGWVKVRHADGLIGYIRAGDIWGL